VIARWKDPASALTHFAGFIAAFVGTALMLSATMDQPIKMLVFGCYGLSLSGLFLASSTYHFYDLGLSGNLLLRRLDHSAIFLLIAGTYLPILVHLLDGAWRITMLSIVVGLAVLGVGFKLVWFHCPRWLDASLYLAMGWMAVIPSPLLYESASASQLALLGGGGLAYTVGAIIYALKWPDPWPDRFGFHDVWHVFVLVGAGCHFAMTWTLIQSPYPPF
jgi:hemolysin III